MFGFLLNRSDKREKFFRFYVPESYDVRQRRFAGSHCSGLIENHGIDFF